MRDGEKSRYALRSARPEEVDEVFSLYEKRVRWMDEKGIRQWNDTDYLNAYPADYYREMRAKDCLYVLTDVARQNHRRGGAAFGGRALGGVRERACVLRAQSRDGFLRVGARVGRCSPPRRRWGRRTASAICGWDCAVDSAFLNGYYESLGYRAAGQCEDGPYVGVKRQKEL